MALQTRTNSADFMRKNYQNGLHAQTVMHRKLLNTLPKAVKDIPGLEFDYQCQISRGGGASPSNSLKVPPNSVIRFGKMLFKLGGITDQTGIKQELLADAIGGKSSAQNSLTLLTETLGNNIGEEKNIQMYGDGTGLRAGITSVSSATALIVPDTRWLRQDGRYDILRRSDGDSSVGGMNLILQFDRDRNVTVVSGTIGGFATINADPASYGIYKHQGYPLATDAGEGDPIWGLQAALGDTNPGITGYFYGGVDRSLPQNEWARGNVLDTGGILREPTFELIQQGFDDVERYGNGKLGMPNIVIMDNDVWNFYMSLLNTKKRYDGSIVDMVGWGEGIKFGSMPPFVKDTMCPPNTIFGVNTNALDHKHDGETQFQDEHGSVLIPIEGQVAYRMVAFERPQLCNKNPKNHFYIKDVMGFSQAA